MENIIVIVDDDDDECLGLPLMVEPIDFLSHTLRLVVDDDEGAP